MVHAKNYETASTFLKVIQRKLLASFIPDTVYISINPLKVIMKCSVYLNALYRHALSTAYFNIQSSIMISWKQHKK